MAKKLTEAEIKKKKLFGNLCDDEDVYQASTICEDLASKVPQRKPFMSTSPSLSWGSAVGMEFGTMELLIGTKSSGKTMIALDRIKMIQATGPEIVCAFVDAEMDFEFQSTIRWMEANGVDTDRVMIIREVNIEKIFEHHILKNIQSACKNDGVKLGGIVLDSIAAMGVKDMPTDLSKIGSKGKGGVQLSKQDYGARANYLAKILPFFRQFVRNYRPMVTFINQARVKGQDMNGNDLYTTNGGEAFYHEQQYRWFIERLEGKSNIITASGTADQFGNEVAIGHKIRWLCEKNKMGEGLGRKGEADIIYMKGLVNKEKEIVNLAAKLGIIEQGGAWYTYNGEKFQGADALAKVLKDDPQEYKKIFAKVMMDASNSQKYS